MGKTEYEYIYFEKVEQKPKTAVYHCKNQRSDGLLGIIRWYGPWRAYCFFPEGYIVFNKGCLEDIIDFIRQIEIKRIETRMKKDSP